MIEFLAKGGVLVIPILLCSVIALTIFLERVIRFYRLPVLGNGLLEKIARHLKAGEDQQAYQFVSSSDTPMGRILTQAMEVKDQDRETLETVLGDKAFEQAFFKVVY